MPKQRFAGLREKCFTAIMKSLTLWSFCLLSLISCAALNAPVRHAHDLSAYKSFCVMPQADDALNLAPLIVQHLKALDIACEPSQNSKPLPSADALIRYRYETLAENTSHLQKLVLEVTDARSGKKVSVSLSAQPPSLMPDSNSDMVAKAVRNLMAATPGPKGHPRGSLMERETLLW